MTEPTMLPYASPFPLAAQGDLFRDGPLLIARDNSTLPPRCILCGQPTSSKPITLKFTWDPSFKVTHAPSTLQLRQSGLIRAALCPTHLASWSAGRRVGIAGMITSALAMLTSVITAIISETHDVPLYSPHAIIALLAFFALFILFLFVFTLKTRTLTCARIEAGYLYLEGAHESFLAPLPPLPISPQTLRP